jgi:lysophospholipid acyltransferase (LPLAT)-like uncharacterized protein
MKNKVIYFLSWLLFRSLMLTYRFEYFGYENLVACRQSTKGFIYGLWHEFFFAAVASHPYQGIRPMISQSRDGEIISRIAISLGFEPVRGSTRRGGKEAREAFYAELPKGLVAAFTADGPKGPRRKLKSGIVDLAREGELRILPLGIAASWSIRVKKAWDHSLIPLPFARVRIYYGEPIDVPKDCRGLAFAQMKSHVAQGLNSVSSF